jgi:hypothetical protein
MSPEFPGEWDKSASGEPPPSSQTGPFIDLTDDSRTTGLDAGRVQTPEPKLGGEYDRRVIPSRSRHGRKVELSSIYHGGTVLFKLLAAIVASLLTAGLLTIEWDGYQKETELRARLISDITTSVSRAKVSAHFIAAGVYGIEERGEGVNIARVKQEYNKRRWDWEHDAARISAQLGAYFRDPEVGLQWQGYWDAMSDYFELSYPGPEKDALEQHGDLRARRKLVGRIARYVESRGRGRALGDSLRKSLEGRSDGRLAKYYEDYRKLGRRLLPEQNSLNKRILAKPTELDPPIGLVRWVKARLG